MILILLILLLLITIAFKICIKTHIVGGGRNKIREYFDYLGSFLKDIINKDLKPIKYYDEIDNQIPYIYEKHIIPTTIHIGQLKLFLNELEFLTDTLDIHDDHCILVYAGSSPSHKAPYLSKLFPNLKIIMIDPAEHLFYYDDVHDNYDIEYRDQTVYVACAEGNRFNLSKDRIINMIDLDTNIVKKIDRNKKNYAKIAKQNKNNLGKLVNFIKLSNYKNYVIEDFFTDDLAEIFAELKSAGTLLFASDIRTNVTDEGLHSKSSPKDIDILFNNAMQFIWINIMKPHKAMLKFRCPYFNIHDNSVAKNTQFQHIFDKVLSINKKLDFIGNYKNKKFAYLNAIPKFNGTTYIQPFAGPYSTEVRLVVSNYNEIIDYDYKQREDKFFYYNRVRRQYGFHYEHKSIFDTSIGIDACGDCALMVRIFVDYLEKYNTTKNTLKTTREHIVTLMKLLRRSFKGNTQHGYFIKKYKNVDEIVNKLIIKKF